MLNSMPFPGAHVVLGALLTLASARPATFELHQDGVGPIAVSL